MVPAPTVAYCVLRLRSTIAYRMVHLVGCGNDALNFPVIAGQHAPDLVERRRVLDRWRDRRGLAVGDLADLARRILPDRVFGSRATTRASLNAATGPIRSRTRPPVRRRSRPPAGYPGLQHH